MSKRSSSRKILFSISFGFLLAALSARAELSQPTVEKDEPIRIRSEIMTAKNAENQVIFERNVVATKGDLWMRADKMVVLFVPPPATSPAQRTPFALGGGSSSEIDHIDAEGNVDLKQGDRRAKADHAVYDQREDTIVLTGNPEVWEKSYQVKGKRMTVFLKENRNVVEESQLMIQNEDEETATPREGKKPSAP